MSLLDQSGVTGGGLDPYNVHALFVNMDNMWTERFVNYDCLVFLSSLNRGRGLGPYGSVNVDAKTEHSEHWLVKVWEFLVLSVRG